jgi:hypothetical protein
VRHEYYRHRRKTRLFQIENALNGNSENVFMSAGLNLNDVRTLHSMSTKVIPGQDKQVDRLIEEVSQRSRLGPPLLHHHYTHSHVLNST